MGFLFIVIALLLLPFLALGVALIVGTWKMFVKAGKPGWASIIPFYSGWVTAEIGDRPGWWGLFASFAFSWEYIRGAPVAVSAVIGLAVLACWVLQILIAIGVAKNFGKSTVFIVVCAIFPFIGYAILGFDASSTYKHAPAARTGQPQANGPVGPSAPTQTGQPAIAETHKPAPPPDLAPPEKPAK